MSYNDYYYAASRMGSGALALTGIISLALAVLLIAALWRLFTKAGEKGWKCLIPIYSGYVWFKITWSAAVWIAFLALSVVMSILNSVGLQSNSTALAVITFIVAIVALVMGIMSEVYTARSYGKGGGFAVGLILLPFIFIPILAFGDSQYIGPKGEPTYRP